MTLLLDSLGAAAGVSAAVLLFRVLPAFAVVARLSTAVRRSLRVVSSPRISDHWKERVLPAYAAQILRNSLLLGFMLVLLLAAYLAAFILVMWPLTGSLDASLGRLIAWPPQLIACVLAIAWGLLQRGKDGSSPYSAAERLLHRLALGSNVVRQLAFDLDKSMVPSRPRHVERPVYIAGLARSGTTLLLEILNATGAFASLSYRNMPFVTAPFLWHQIARHFHRTTATRERAHGDGIDVDPDSPEAFEEVFWLTVCASDYVTDRGLIPHHPGPDVIHDYRRFVNNVLYANDETGKSRYLCKGTNNLLRLPAIREAFPDVVILIPFRHPLMQADSLLRQHQRFLAIHESDRFSLQYMNWLGHFEFGANLKPFLFESSESILSGDPLTMAYWLEYWRAVYYYVLENSGDQVAFIDYDVLCASPEDSLAALAGMVGVDPAALSRAASRVTPPTQAPSGDLDANITAVYQRLTAGSAI